MAYGTLVLTDTQASTNQSVIEYGEEKTYLQFEQYRQAHNLLMQDKIDTFVGESTTDRLRRYGGVQAMTMEDTDEFNRVDSQKVTTGQDIGFPLRRGSIALQWTRDYLNVVTPVELAAQFTTALDADILWLDLAVRRAFFKPTNYTFVDRLVDSVNIPVKALLNADSVDVPIGPSGLTFNGATHNHYLGTSSLVAADISALIETVTEHFTSGVPLLYINRAQEAAVRAMTNNFSPFFDSRLIVADTVTHAAQSLDMISLYDRAIGLFDAAEVHVKPWVPAGYMLVWMQGQSRALVMRTRKAGSSGLNLDFENDAFPLRARQMSREVGFGVFTRHAAAVLDTAHATYNTPSGL
jgi:hypothetical protein